MECPKCHKIISDNLTTCPHCKRVISLVCPNCHNITKNTVCEKCGYIILEKCAKCGKLTPTSNETCKCGLSVKSSIASHECETDEFASVTISFGALRSIRTLLGSQELYTKFLLKLKNLINTQLKDLDCHIIIYGDTYVINFNKELSFPTSVNKAVRLSIKILNSFAGLNTRLQEELGTPLKITLTINMKKAEELLVNKSVESNVKLLTTSKKDEKKYLKGMQIILDQYSQDCINKDFKTDSLFLMEHDGNAIMYYEILLDNYILPPGTSDADENITVQKNNSIIPETKIPQNDIYSFKVFDINAKCKFEKCYSDQILSNIKPETKIISIRGEKELQIKTSLLIDFYKNNGYKAIYVSCSEKMNYKPWGFLLQVFKEYYNILETRELNEISINKSHLPISDLICEKIIKAATPEDARYTYMELFGNFLFSLKNYVIIVDGFEYLDDTSIQTLELYFDKFNSINVNFVFLTSPECAVHTKIKGLLQTSAYTEYSVIKNDMATLLSDIKEDAEDFIQSFYYEKIKENFNGSQIYFENAIKYLTETDILTSFNNKLIIKSNSSVLIPKNLEGLIRKRLKVLSKNQDASMILAYSVYFGERLDFKTLEQLGINKPIENAKVLENSGYVFTKDNTVYINNYSLMKPFIQSSIKPETEELLAKNIISKIGKRIDNTTLLTLMGILSKYKEEYIFLWKNAQLSIESGDYDSYLKNCLGFLSITDKIGDNIPKEAIETNKKEVFHNILMSLYGYSPEKIYSIENILLMDAIHNEDDEKIVKLSNLMLQGALISSNYTDALSLLHNILERMQNASLIVDGAINTKFLLLSLVNIEILFNIGNFERCIEVGNEVLGVITPDIIEKIKPASFSVNMFTNHLLDTFRLVGFAKLLTADKNLSEFFEDIYKAFNIELPDKNCIITVSEYLKGKEYSPSNIENSTAFSKVVYLILQELTKLKNNYKLFAQNIYQAKLLAHDIHQKQFEYICDLLIAYAYSKIGISQKTEYIYNDVLEKSENSTIFNIVILARYFISTMKIEFKDYEDAMLLINDTLSDLQKQNNQAKVFYALFENLYINIAQEIDLPSFDLSSEKQKLASIAPNGELERITKSSEDSNNNNPTEKQDNFIEPLPLEDDNTPVSEVEPDVE